MKNPYRIGNVILNGLSLSGSTSRKVEKPCSSESLGQQDSACGTESKYTCVCVRVCKCVHECVCS